MVKVVIGDRLGKGPTVLRSRSNRRDRGLIPG